MNMQKVNIVIQFLIRFFIIFLLVYVWIKFLIKDSVPTIILTLSISILIELLIKILLNKKNQKCNLKEKEKNNAENMFFSLVINNNYLAFFKELACKRHLVKVNKSYITVIQEDQNVILYPFMNLAELTPNDINNILITIKKENYKKIVIPCGEISKESFNFIKNFQQEIVLLDKYETYDKLYKDYDFFPEITHFNRKKTQFTFKELLALSLNKKKAKNYLIAALLLLFSSIFVRLNLYYCITSSILLLLSLVSLLNPFEQEKTPPFSL